VIRTGQGRRPGGRRRWRPPIERHRAPSRWGVVLVSRVGAQSRESRPFGKPGVFQNPASASATSILLRASARSRRLLWGPAAAEYRVDSLLSTGSNHPFRETPKPRACSSLAWRCGLMPDGVWALAGAYEMRPSAAELQSRRECSCRSSAPLQTSSISRPRCLPASAKHRSQASATDVVRGALRGADRCARRTRASQSRGRGHDLMGAAATSTTRRAWSPPYIDDG
jgi:hypothetical protein